MANVAPYLIDPAILAAGWTRPAPPLAFVEVDRLGTTPPALPPFPIIGLGDPDHPAARNLDAVVESPISADAIVRQVTRHPYAAAAAIHVLRGIDGLPMDRALSLESMCYAMLQGSAEHIVWRDSRCPAAPAPAGHVILTRDDATLHIAIDRPAARNAIDVALRDGLFDAFTLAALDTDITRVDLRSVGPVFSVGADLAEFGTTPDPSAADQIRRMTLPAYPLSRCAAIVHVHVQGACVGSAMEMAAFAGRVTASPTAWFQLPELAMGIIPGAGGCVSVPRRIGRQRAALMILSGRRIDAVTASRWGLVDAIVDQPPVDPGCTDRD